MIYKNKVYIKVQYSAIVIIRYKTIYFIIDILRNNFIPQEVGLAEEAQTNMRITKTKSLGLSTKNVNAPLNKFYSICL